MHVSVSVTLQVAHDEVFTKPLLIHSQRIVFEMSFLF